MFLTKGASKMDKDQQSLEDIFRIDEATQMEVSVFLPQAKSILEDPKTFKDAYTFKDADGRIRDKVNPGYLARKLLHEVRGDNEFLKKIVEIYLNCPSEGFVAANAIASMTPGDDVYFIGVFERLDKLRETTQRYKFSGYGIGIARDEGNLFRISLKNLADFESRLKGKPSRDSLESVYVDLVNAMNEARKNWSPLELGIEEFLGHPEVVVELNNKFVKRFASSLEKYGLKERAEELRNYNKTQLKQAEANIRLRQESSDHWHERAAAMNKITDQKYLKDVVSAVPNDFEFGYESPQAIAVSKINDPSFLEEILKTKKDVYIIRSAIGSLTNTKLLESYANSTDDECDQHNPSLISREERGEAADKSEYRDAARERLQELGLGKLIKEPTFPEIYQRVSKMDPKRRREIPGWNIIASLNKKLGFGFDSNRLRIGVDKQDIVIYYRTKEEKSKEVYININPDYIATKASREIGTGKETTETYTLKHT